MTYFKLTETIYKRFPTQITKLFGLLYNILKNIVCSSCYKSIKRKDERHVTRIILNMNMDGFKGKGSPKNRWMGYVKMKYANRINSG